MFYSTLHSAPHTATTETHTGGLEIDFNVAALSLGNSHAQVWLSSLMWANRFAFCGSLFFFFVNFFGFISGAVVVQGGIRGEI